MSPEYYLDMCTRHLNNSSYYISLNKNDPSELIKNRITTFANFYKEQLTIKEFNYLTNFNYKMANFYMLPKIHKSKQINEIISNTQKEYYNITEHIEIDGRPIVAGCAYYTHGLSRLVHKILEPLLQEIPHILQDTFDFVDKSNKTVEIGTVFGTADIKSLYNNITHDAGIKSVSFWLHKLSHKIPLLNRFSKNFVLEALNIILKYNYFFINDTFYHQIKGTAMGTTAAVVYANLHVAYIEVSLFNQLPNLYPLDFVQFFLQNYFRFLDDINYKWQTQYDIKPLHNLLNSIDPNIQFIFEDISNTVNFLDVQCTIEQNQINFDIYHKPTNSFSYLHYKSCHPRHTKDNIALSLGRRIIKIVTKNIKQRLNQLSNHLILREHPVDSVSKTLTRLYSPENNPNSDKENLIFIHTYNPNTLFKKSIISNVFKNLKDEKMISAFSKTHTLISTRQEKSIQQLLTRAKFTLEPSLLPPKIYGLFPCNNNRCKLHTLGYITQNSTFTFNIGSKQFIWKYNRYFDCNSKNLVYMMVCCKCGATYIGETQNLRERMNNAKSSIRKPSQAVVPYAQHLHDCSNLVEPFFYCYPFYYEDDTMFRRFKEWRFIKRFKPVLNKKY